MRIYMAGNFDLKRDKDFIDRFKWIIHKKGRKNEKF